MWYVTQTHTQNPKQDPGSELSAQSPMRGSNSQTARLWPESKPDAQPTKPPRRPHQLMDIYALSIIWLLLKVLLSTLGYKCPYASVLLYPLGKFLAVLLLGHRVVLFLIFWGTSTLFSRVAASVCLPTNSARGFPFLHILTSIYSFMICSF